MPPRSEHSVTVRVPAKINLHLGVGELREDGYHDLLTVYHAVSLLDELTATAADELTLTVCGEGAAELSIAQDNLVLRAAYALAGRIGRKPLAALTLTKSIPVAGGLAGGSADAAAALVALDALWETGLERDDLLAVAATIGSDVPFLVVGGTALGTGRGELVAPVLSEGTYHWVLALADDGLSTPDVYREIERRRSAGPLLAAGAADDLLAALRTADPVLLGRLLANDLEPAAVSLRPTLRRTLAAGREHGALGALVSGSGPTCAFLAHSAEHAARLAVGLSAEGVCRGVRLAEGPVPGARIVAG